MNLIGRVSSFDIGATSDEYYTGVVVVLELVEVCADGTVEIAYDEPGEGKSKPRNYVKFKLPELVALAMGSRE